MLMVLQIFVGGFRGVSFADEMEDGDSIVVEDSALEGGIDGGDESDDADETGETSDNSEAGDDGLEGSDEDEPLTSDGDDQPEPK